MPYKSSITQKKIWGSSNLKIPTVHYVGTKELNEREKSYIETNNKEYLFLNTEDSYSNIAKKTLMAFQEIYKNYEFDFIFRTNTSSFIDLKKLEHFINFESDNLSYSGKLTETTEGFTIASGAGFFISKENVSILLKNTESFDEKLPDDVAIAKTLSQLMIFPTNLRRVDLKNVPNPRFIKENKGFHYRCRLDPQFHRLLEPLLFKYLNFVSKDISIISKQFAYIFVKLLFNFSNIKINRKLIQKYYSYKFYGELQIGNKIIYRMDE